MKLLVVTGISHSNWMEYIDAMEIPFQVVSAEIQSKLESLGSINNKKVLTKKVREVIQKIDSKKPQVVYLPSCLSYLNTLMQNGSVKSLVFYCEPDLSVAHALAEKLMTAEECLAASETWKQEVQSAFKIYRKYKTSCLLVSCQDVFENSNESQSAISAFVKTQMQIKHKQLFVPQDRLLAAKLLLQEQDDLFDYYDEIRSDLPVFGKFKVSGGGEVSELSAFALDVIEEHQIVAHNLTQSVKKHLEDIARLESKIQYDKKQYSDLLQEQESLKTNCEILSQKLSDLYDEKDKLKSQIKEGSEESGLQMLLINQLQEELELKYEQSKLNTQKIHQLERKLVETRSETEVQKQLVSKLQKELKQSIETFTDTNQKCIQLENQLEQASNGSELMLLQIGQLQEELEFTCSKHSKIQEQFLAYKNQVLTEQNVYVDKIRDLEVEKSLTTMQIHQLQEELEYYYQKLQEKDSSSMLNSELGNKPVQKVYEKCAVKTAEILAGYNTDGYRDIQLKLSQVAIADGRFFESVYCKLLEVDGRPGIEFRPLDNSLELQWIDELNDEYGHYITYVPNPSESQSARQQKVDQSLRASDRLAILSIGSLIYEALQKGDLIISKDMEESELRDWRLNAIELKSQIESLPEWLSFDGISLLEEFHGEGYEHLWFKFENFLINDQYFPEFEVKFAAIGNSDENFSTDQIILELRELPSGFSPLQAWPPELKDDFGYKFLANINLHSDSLEISAADKTSMQDKQLISHLIKNLSNFIQATLHQGSVLLSEKVDWNSIGLLLQQVNGFAGAELVNENEQIEEKEEKHLEDKFQFAEFVDLGGYQHLVFDYTVDDDTKLKLKVRAEEINFENGDAKVALELRTGDELVPLANSDYFAEDEYGPRVLFDLSEVEMLISDETLEIEHRALLQGFIGALPALIETIQDFDDQAQINWISWVSE
ncbi:hypothetical protein Q4574_01525 [Aliiglaciecola sp. 3_MG-2023]|uniref:hypothetical protein n=1 Tax=Aliiglaciecola sp. 3_MG-2023 TaxID=3062644 RepID=UPI0026E247CB|nr:hypothetical protein [Aliiglaciecola sp. 3_MG-2023]MDO6691939.1 hypothetical protein [Aliiglaciecola sp. 3_MG-2023]